MIFHSLLHKQRLWNLFKRFQFDEKQHLDLLFKIGNTRPCQLVGDGWSQSPDWIKWRKVRAIVLSFPDTTYCLLLCISSSGLDQDFLGFQMPMIRNGEKLPKMWLSLLTFKIEWKKAPCSILIFFFALLVALTILFPKFWYGTFSNSVSIMFFVCFA